MVEMTDFRIETNFPYPLCQHLAFYIKSQKLRELLTKVLRI